MRAPAVPAEFILKFKIYKKQGNHIVDAVGDYGGINGIGAPCEIAENDAEYKKLDSPPWVGMNKCPSNGR